MTPDADLVTFANILRRALPVSGSDDGLIRTLEAAAVDLMRLREENARLTQEREVGRTNPRRFQVMTALSYRLRHLVDAEVGYATVDAATMQEAADTIECQSALLARCAAWIDQLEGVVDLPTATAAELERAALRAALAEVGAESQDAQ